MILKRLTIKSFGKLHDKNIEFSPGINVLYGENESGKTTVHTFIRSMFYGIIRQRGRASRNDIYARYEPWEHASDFGGTMWFENEGENYRLTRNFYKENQTCELLCEDDGEELDVKGGDLEAILGGVSEAVYDNTVSIGQLKSVTGPDLAREVQNYMASYQGAGDSTVDLGRASQMLKMWRKGYQVQQEKNRKDTEREKEKLSAKMEYLSQEMEELRNRRNGVQEKEAELSAQAGAAGIDHTAEVMEEQIQDIRRKRQAMSVGMGIAVLLGVTALFARFRFSDGMSRFGLDLCVLIAIGAVVLFLRNSRKLEYNLARQKKLRARWMAKQEKLKWNRENISQAYEEKRIDFINLQNDYQEYEAQAYMPTVEDTEIQALNLAMDTIQELSGNIHRQVGFRFRQRTSRILREITGGKYQEVVMDRDLHMSVNTEDKMIPIERLSRGTVEQVYFALRMAAGELLCGESRFPVILDDIFGMYDEERLLSVLRWLEGQNRQVLICTCNKREIELMEREGIAFSRVQLS